MDDPDMSLAELGLEVELAYAQELSSWARVWARAMAGTSSLDSDVLISGVPFSGRQVVRALLAELPLPRSEGQEEVAKRLMGLL